MITIAELKRALRMSAADNTRNADLQACADAALAWFQNRTRRYFGEPRERVERINGGIDSAVLYLAETPVATPAIVVETQNGTGWDTTDEADYELDGSAVYMLEGYWPYGTRNIRVTYHEGYEPGTVPADVRQAVLAVAVAMWKEGEKGNMQSETIGGYSYTVKDEGELPTFVRQTVGAYQRIRL